MKRSQTFLPLFLLCLVIVLSVGGLGLLFKIQGISLVQMLFAPFQKITVAITQNSSVSETKKLAEKLVILQTKLAHEQNLLQENQALRDQFQTTMPTSKDLLPATIVGMPQFFPGVSSPEYMIINTGVKEGVQVGMSAVYKDNLVGKVTKVTAHFAQVTVLGNTSISLTGYTASTNSLGVIKGLGNGQLLFDNVLLSNTLSVGDIILTSGDVSLQGTGNMPGLVVGKITSVEKNPSALFQKGAIQSLVDVSRLKMIFIVK